MSRATDRPHAFIRGGKCVFCGVSPEKVADRRAAPFCEARDDHDGGIAGCGVEDGY